jgi:hypothetical protein
VRGARLEGFLTGAFKAPEEFIGDKDNKTTNPAHEVWLALDQQVMGFLLSSLTREVLQQVATCKNAAAAAWKTIEGSFGSQTRACAVNVHMSLATTQKGAMSITEYMTKMCALSDEMSAARKALDDEEMVSYILASLDIEYNYVVSAILARVEPISVNELYGQLLSFESCQALLGGNMLSANASMHGQGHFNHGCSGGRGRNNNSNNYHTNNYQNHRGNSNNGKRPTCQVCEKEEHTTVQC